MHPEVTLNSRNSNDVSNTYTYSLTYIEHNLYHHREFYSFTKYFHKISDDFTQSKNDQIAHTVEQNQTISSKGQSNRRYPCGLKLPIFHLISPTAPPLMSKNTN